MSVKGWKADRSLIFFDLEISFILAFANDFKDEVICLLDNTSNFLFWVATDDILKFIWTLSDSKACLPRSSQGDVECIGGSSEKEETD